MTKFYRSKLPQRRDALLNYLEYVGVNVVPKLKAANLRDLHKLLASEKLMIDQLFKAFNHAFLKAKKAGVLDELPK